MNLSTKTVCATLVIAGAPQVASASGSTSSLIPGGAPIFLTAGSLALFAVGLALWRGRSQDNNSTRILRRYLKGYQKHWQQWAIETCSPGEVESAICSFETYIKAAGIDRIAAFIAANRQDDEQVSYALLEQAKKMHPGAYREFDSRGKQDQTTLFARKYFLVVIKGGIQQIVNQMAIEYSDHTIADRPVASPMASLAV